MAAAQVFTINGRVLEEGSGKPLPYVNLWITGSTYGTSTNHEGVFEIKIDERLLTDKYTMSFSCIGYHSKEVTLSTINPSKYWKVVLKPSLTQLSAVVILTDKFKRKQARRALRLVERALVKIPSNYPKDPYVLNTFYRHYCSEDTSYVRLIEAALDVYSPKYNFSYAKIPEERLAFKITQLRRSFDFTSNTKLVHPPISVNFLISNDLTSFNYHNPLRLDLDKYDFSMGDTTNLGEDKVLVVNFEEKENLHKTGQLMYTGKLFILHKNLAFIRAEIEQSEVHKTNYDSLHAVVKKIIVFKEYNKRYYMDRISSDVTAHHVSIDSLGNPIKTLKHLSHIELITNNITLKDLQPFEGREPRSHELRRIEYDSVFWKRYTILKETTLEAKIVEDLSTKLSLEKQFQTINTIEAGGMSVTESKEFKDLIKKYTDTPIYLVLWSNWNQLNHIALQPVQYFKRKIKKNRAKLVFVVINKSKDDWVKNRKFYGLDKKYFDHQRIDLGFDEEITRIYFNNLFPYYMAIDKTGKILSGEPPLPSEDAIKPYMKVLIKQK